jgi:hypothetical protein
MLLLGIILMTSYLTKAYDNNTTTQVVQNDVNTHDTTSSIDQAYTMRPSQVFDTMFNQPSLWQGYQTVSK